VAGRHSSSFGGHPARVLGLAVWAAALVLLPAPLAARILLLAPLVVVPALLAGQDPPGLASPVGGAVAFLAALPLVVAFALPPGVPAGVLALPWMGAGLLAAAWATRAGLAALPGILRPDRIAELGLHAALVFLGVAAAFTAVDRFGIETGFSSTIVLLTATHFHFAGFGLLTVAALLAKRRGWLRASVLGLIAGIPLTALGFVLRSDELGAVGAVVVGLAGIGVGVGLLGAARSGLARWGTRLAGVALLVGMPLGIAWSVAILLDLRYLDMDTMIRTHGALNATAVLLGALLQRDEP
jgi:hypothetical protein